jgi:hypothetical protein
MSNWYANAVLTVIALLLLAIVAKLYLPVAQLVGPQLSPPSRGDVAAARKLTDSSIRSAHLEELRLRAPAVWVSGGEIEVRGNVTIDNTVDVQGDVSIVD